MGQVVTHRPQPMHRCGPVLNLFLLEAVKAPTGQRATHVPQSVQSGSFKRTDIIALHLTGRGREELEGDEHAAAAGAAGAHGLHFL